MYGSAAWYAPAKRGLRATDLMSVSYLQLSLSRSPHRLLPREKLYVIISSTYDGTLVYTKGTIRKTQDVEEYYLLISAKKNTV